MPRLDRSAGVSGDAQVALAELPAEEAEREL